MHLKSGIGSPYARDYLHSINEEQLMKSVLTMEKRAYGAAVAILSLLALIAFVMPGWIISALLICVIVLGIVALQRRFPGIETRFAIMLGLFGSADFLKRLIFLLPGQSAWSQYLFFLLPYLYFFGALLIPWILERQDWALSTLQKTILALCGWLLFNTWFIAGSSLFAKSAATGILVMPWLIVAVAADHPGALEKTGKTLAVLGVISALYGVLQFISGPTPIELRWAQASGDISIGADQLVAALTNRHGSVFIWRPIGMQADAFTFGLFLLNVLALTWLLCEMDLIPRRIFVLLGLVLLGGIFASIVRGIWAATVVVIAYALLARRFRWLGKPWIVLGLMVAAFWIVNEAAGILYNFRALTAQFNNPLVARIFTLGTLEARMRAGSNFWLALPGLLWRGYGYAASPWITNKFGGFQALPANFGEHNVVVEMLWLFGLPGLLLFFIVNYQVVANIWNAFRNSNHAKGVIAVTSAYIFGMYVSGLINGGVYLNPIFFFVIGVMVSNRKPEQEKIG
jgi:hypothetical protein